MDPNHTVAVAVYIQKLSRAQKQTNNLWKRTFQCFFSYQIWHRYTLFSPSPAGHLKLQLT